VTHRGPCQPPPCWDSVTRGFVLGLLGLQMEFVSTRKGLEVLQQGLVGLRVGPVEQHLSICVWPSRVCGRDSWVCEQDVGVCNRDSWVCTGDSWVCNGDLWVCTGTRGFAKGICEHVEGTRRVCNGT